MKNPYKRRLLCKKCQKKIMKEYKNPKSVLSLAIVKKYRRCAKGVKKV